MARDEKPVPIPITGELDLHTFDPRDTKALLTAYFEACRDKQILHVRIVHGKGTGTLRATVHAFLQNAPEVESYRLGDETSGSWGATIVKLRPKPSLSV